MEKKKLNYKTVLVASALFIAIFAQVGFLGSVLGPEGQQHNIWGTTSKAGNSPPGLDISTNRTITAWIDGVTYGYNWTEDTGAYDVYVDGDAWGTDKYNWVKDGGWDGDLIYYFLDYDPSNYYLDISSHTSTFDIAAYELVDPIYFDTQTESDNSTDTYLRGVKINEIVLTPGDGYPQYVILYDPVGELSETAIENNYYLEKDDPFPTTPPDPQGPLFDFSLPANEPYVEPYGPGLNYYFINLTGFTLNADDELKLVWKNPPNWGGPPTVDNICNGIDVIVDRVEWGEHHNYIHPNNPPDDRDYDNTTMLNYPDAPGTGESIIRSTNGTDTDHCDVDFTPQLIASPRPIQLPDIWETDYIEIVDSPGSGTTTIPVTLTVGVGETITGYAAAFNNTLGGWYADVTATWTVGNTGTNATTAPLSGSSSTFYSGWQPGTATWTADDGLGHTYMVTITVLAPEPDMIDIVDTPGTGLTGIIDQSIVLGGGITGYAAGYNNTIGYYGDVSVTWSVIWSGGQDATSLPGSGTTSDFDSGTVIGQVHWLAEYGGGVNDTVVIDIIPPVGGVPGFPTDLRVHKGGGAWGGISGDIVLYWKAPTVNYPDLVANIVYYDTDLSDGFQYTLWIQFTPNATGAGSDDWCILPGWDADSSDYAFIVRTTGIAHPSNENSTGTNIGYKYIMTLQTNPGPGTQFKWIALPYYNDYQFASDICGPTEEFIDNTVIDTLVKWNFATQKYDSRYWAPFPPPAHWQGDFAINPGDALGIIVTTAVPIDWSIVGSHDDTLQFELLKNPGPGTQFKTMSLPYHKVYTSASDICGPTEEFTDNTIFDTIVQWNFASQRYDSRYWAPFPPPAHWQNDFAINLTPGDALGFIITADIAYYWTPAVITL